jgi:hypothetical protein
MILYHEDGSNTTEDSIVQYLINFVFRITNSSDKNRGLLCQNKDHVQNIWGVMYSL